MIQERCVSRVPVKCEMKRETERNEIYQNKTKRNETKQDLDKLAEWESKWLMKFHPEECNVLAISKKRSPFKYNYTLHGHILEHDTSAKYLGCTISSDLKWGKRISTICSKANNTISFLKRNINISNKSIKEKAYVSLVRPTLEYVSSV